MAQLGPARVSYVNDAYDEDRFAPPPTHSELPVYNGNPDGGFVRGFTPYQEPHTLPRYGADLRHSYPMVENNNAVPMHSLRVSTAGMSTLPPKPDSVPDDEPEVDDPDDDPDEGFDDLPQSEGALTRLSETLSSVWQAKKRYFWIAFIILIVLAFIVYFALAMYMGVEKDANGDAYLSEGATRLLWVTCFVVLAVVISVCWDFCAARIPASKKSAWSTYREKHARFFGISNMLICGLIIAGLLIYVVIDVLAREEYYNLVSIGGMVVYVVVLFIFSKHPTMIRWDTVAWGLALQMIFAVLILKTSWGRWFFDFLGDRTNEFLQHTDAGSSFVFGDAAARGQHFFAFSLMPIIIFFSSVISILYYLGAMQFCIDKLARLMKITMDTTAAESLNAAGNIFIGMTEAPLLIRPYLADMTQSEIHAVMTGGFATIAGSVLGIYIGFGVPATHLLSASVMSAPAALAMAKLFWPETRVSKTSADTLKAAASQERNLLEAAAGGASASIYLVANILANLIAFLGLLSFFNATLTWFGQRLWFDGVESPLLTFELIASYLFWPCAIVMGADVGDGRKLGELLGTKTFINEFIAYQRLSEFICNREVYTVYSAAQNATIATQYNPATLYDDILFTVPTANGTTTAFKLVKGLLQPRTETLATYALCGFANIGSIGIMIGGLTAMAPQRKRAIASVALRAMIAGNVACFLTACIAGIFYEPDKGSLLSEVSSKCLSAMKDV